MTRSERFLFFLQDTSWKKMNVLVVKNANSVEGGAKGRL